MTDIPAFNEAMIDSLARWMSEHATLSEINSILKSCGFEDLSGASSKFKICYRNFIELQSRHRSANPILRIISSYLAPARFVSQRQEFELRRETLNKILIFAGLAYGATGEYVHIRAAKTLDEAERRLQTIMSKFSGRRMHPEVLKYCTSELLQDNYFHAIFEAMKGLAERLRNMTGLTEDGSYLVDQAFSIKQPLLAINTLQTETERSEQVGYANLLKGCFSAIRNPIAHKPKILWEGEDDAADYLTLISLLHRKLDEAVHTHSERYLG